MKTIALTGIGQMETRQAPEPQIVADNDVLLRVGSVGVCGSDVHYYTTGRIGSQVVQYPFVVGHECSGIVEAVGPAVTKLQPGDRVAVEPANPCFACDQCAAGRINTCRKLTFLGCPGQVEGCLKEKLVMPEHCCFPVGEATTLDRAALVEPLSIGLYAANQAGELAGKTIAILGSGPIGLSTLLPARLAEPAAVYVTDKIDARLAVAADRGADWTGNPDTTDVVADILARSPEGVDVVFECCGQQDACDQAVELLKPGGTLMMTGIPEVDRIGFEIDKMRRKEITFQNVRRQAHCVQPAMDLVESGRLDVDFMVTHEFDFDDTQAAFDLVESYADGVIKAMIHIHRE